MNRVSAALPAAILCAALLASSGPVLSQSPAPHIRGDANASLEVDLADAVYLLSFLFLGGSPPPCQALADANASQELDISDALTILNYLFSGTSTIRIRHFHYDGDGGIGVYIWLHNGGDLRVGKKIGEDIQIGFPGYVDALLSAEIPGTIPEFSFHSVAIWCTTFDLNFGSTHLRE